MRRTRGLVVVLAAAAVALAAVGCSTDRDGKGADTALAGIDATSVKIGYTIIGVNSKKILSARTGRGPVPLRQLVSDVSGDKVFDLYFHLKAWTINGWIGGQRAYWTMNGSSNISALSQASDENIGVFRHSSVALAYQRHIEYWFNNPPRSRPVVPSLVPANLDPYANMEKDY